LFSFSNVACEIYLACFSDEHHKRLMPISEDFSPAVKISAHGRLYGQFCWQCQRYFCVCHLINCQWTIQAPSLYECHLLRFSLQCV